ncbi:hypothetical protein [Anabaena sp. PCC 7108]|nr:hypothetical protein [Anabaena sp. PCC 7108]
MTHLNTVRLRVFVATVLIVKRSHLLTQQGNAALDWAVVGTGMKILDW